MGEPSLWNPALFQGCGWREFGFNPSWESRPSGTCAQTGFKSFSTSFNPSWESRPSGTLPFMTAMLTPAPVSTPHGRAVPLELLRCLELLTRVIRFNPSWESRPSGTTECASPSPDDHLFQPLMGEPSLWNTETKNFAMVYILPFQPLMGEPSLWNIFFLLIAPTVYTGFNPSWESRPSGTRR